MENNDSQNQEDIKINPLLEKVKSQLGITSQDEQLNKNLQIKIEAIKEFLIQAGAKIDDSCVSDRVITCISIGVNDLLNTKAGEIRFSPAFNMFTQQIAGGD